MFELIPAIDVLAGEVVRLRQGRFDAVTVYADDPVDVAQRFMAAGATLVHVVDLDGARTGEPDRELRQRLAAAGVAFQTGGGLRSVEAVTAAVADGASRAVVGTAAVWDEPTVAAMVSAVGAGALVAAVDVAAGMARGSGWLDAGRPVSDVVAGLATAGVARALVTAIARDGEMSGPDLDLLEEVAASRIDVIASGGIASLDDLTAVKERGLSGAIVGRAIYEDRFTVAEAIAATA